MFKNMVFGLLALSLVSCGKSNSSGKSGPDADKFRGISALEVNESAIYQSECSVAKVDGEKTYSMYRFVVKMTGSYSVDVTMNQAMFTENCEYPMMETEIAAEGFFLNNNTLLKTDVNTIQMRPLHDVVTEYMNNDSACGFNNWETYVQKDITHSSCVEGDLASDIYMDSKNNDAILTIYMCEPNARLSNKCEKVSLRKI